MAASLNSLWNKLNIFKREEEQIERVATVKWKLRIKELLDEQNFFIVNDQIEIESSLFFGNEDGKNLSLNFGRKS